ncbi:hypothetical protein [Pseudoxanthomonas suwonensis]|uniref:hypothetical protein n=1 Tax=Pseudoxanthomonas suwonensis TaxID=314722 RepID=UPI0006986275|nr:hypothetical protein [Pseudoxanthomonas suwonensis]
MRSTIAVLACLLSAGIPAHASEARAQQVFAEYQARARAFDPAVADLYCDTAIIRNVRMYPDGQQRTLELPAPKYKELIRTAMPLAKARGDHNTYSDIEFNAEGSNVRIAAIRYSVLKGYSSPISILVGSCNGGKWAVLEELSQSRP